MDSPKLYEAKINYAIDSIIEYKLAFDFFKKAKLLNYPVVRTLFGKLGQHYFEQGITHAKRGRTDEIIVKSYDNMLCDHKKISEMVANLGDLRLEIEEIKTRQLESLVAGNQLRILEKTPIPKYIN